MSIEDTDRLTLAEMAQRLKLTPKTLKKHVAKRGIPHLAIGTSLRFDPIEVEAAFRVQAAQPRRTVRKQPAAAGRGRFADQLGL